MTGKKLSDLTVTQVKELARRLVHAKRSRLALLTALNEIEVNVSSNENKPTSVLANIGRIARAAIKAAERE